MSQRVLLNQFAVSASSLSVVQVDVTPRGIIVLGFEISLGTADPGSVQIYPYWTPISAPSAYGDATDIGLVDQAGNIQLFRLGSRNPRVPINSFVTPAQGYLSCIINNGDATNAAEGYIAYVTGYPDAPGSPSPLP